MIGGRERRRPACCASSASRTLHARVLRHLARGGRRRDRAGDRRRARGARRVGELALEPARGRLPARGRPARRPVARATSTPPRCSARARPCARPRSTPPPSSSTSCASTRTSPSELAEQQPISTPGRPQPPRAARRSRASSTRHAVQLHGDRRQPADRAGADGQHRRLEAVARPRCSRQLVDVPDPARGRAARRRDQLRARRSASRSSRSASITPSSPACTSRARAQVFRSLFREVGERIDRYRVVPAARRRDGRQGLRRRARLGRAAGGRDRARARLVRVPGAEVLGGLARLHPRHALARGARARRSRSSGEIRQGDPPISSTFMGAVIDGARSRGCSEAHRGRKASSERRRIAAAAAAPTTARAGSSSRRSSRPTDPHFDTMQRELFGPCLTVYSYPETRYAETLELCDGTSPYALTGSIFARDRARDRAGAPRRCATPPATSTSTTSPRARSSASSPSAAVARLGHERQGRLVEQPRALVVAAHGQGDARSAARSATRYPAHGARRTTGQ